MMMDDYYISTEKEVLDIEKIHKEVKNSYWGSYRTMELTKATINNSLCFGLYTKQNKQVGFARVLSDHVVFAYIMDIMIFEPYKGKGLGKMLVEFIMEYPTIKNVLTFALKTKDAHGLYEQFGFKPVGNSSIWMAKDKAKLD